VSVLSLALLVAAFLLAPIAVVVPMSFSTAISFEFPPPGYSLGYYARYFTSEEWIEPTVNSLVIAVGATLFTLLLVVPAAFGCVRYRFRGKSLVILLIMSPLIVPHVVSALAYYGFLGRVRLTGPATRGTGFEWPVRSRALPGVSMSTPASAVAKRFE